MKKNMARVAVVALAVCVAGLSARADVNVDSLLARLSTFDLGFKFFRGHNFQNAACGAAFVRLSP